MLIAEAFATGIKIYPRNCKEKAFGSVCGNKAKALIAFADALRSDISLTVLYGFLDVIGSFMGKTDQFL